MKGKSKNKIKKILLIYPPINIFDYEIRNYAPPLGLMYLTAVAEKKYDVRILDCVIEGMEHRINKTIRLGLTDDEIEKYKNSDWWCTCISFAKRYIIRENH